MNTQTRTMLLLLSTFMALIILLSSFVYYSVMRFSNESFFKLLEVKALTAAKSKLDIQLGQGTRKIEEIRSVFFEELPERREFIIPITENQVPDTIPEHLGIPVSFFQKALSEKKATYRKGSYSFFGIRYASTEGEFLVIAGAENDTQASQAAYLRRVLLFAIIASFFISIFISVYFAKYIVDPLKQITDKVRQISSENLHLRLGLGNKNDELKELAITFNDMLDRIETSFETQNNFISNASHELRTPLTAIIGEADVALAKPRTTLEYEESLKVIIDEAEKLEAKTKALLFLAQTGFDGKIQKFEKVRIDQLLWDVKETLEKLNPGSKIYIDMQLLPENPARLKVKGNEQLLHLALSNIISNACKYSNFKMVNISIGASESKVFIVVRDSGIGIPAAELKYIYDPFFRASNTKNFEGYGIGLPLTRNIIRMHHGELHVSSLEGKGTTVEVILPAGMYELEHV